MPLATWRADVGHTLDKLGDAGYPGLQPGLRRANGKGGAGGAAGAQSGDPDEDALVQVAAVDVVMG